MNNKMAEKKVERRKDFPVVEVKTVVEEQKAVERLSGRVETKAKNSLYPENNIRFY